MSNDAAEPLEQCHHCEELVPAGAFCGNCGAHLADYTEGRTRLHAYAAAPHEHVRRAAIVSTLFPHLPHRHAHVFSQVLTGGVLLVILLSAVRLNAPATITAAVLLPVLYLLYLWEVEIYEHEPIPVLLLTLVAGIVLGWAYETLLNLWVSGTGSSNPLLVGVALPVIAQLLMVATPLLLLSRSHFDETLDGLAFGVTTALGFTMTMIITREWNHLTNDLLINGTETEDFLRLLRIALLPSLINATATGLITAALWQKRHRRSRGRHNSTMRALPVSIFVAFAAQIGLGFISLATGLSQLLQAGLQVILAMILLIWLRVLIHHALLDEGAEHLIGPPSACHHCHRMVPTMLFCPACGVARSAAPKHARVSAHREEAAPA